VGAGAATLPDVDIGPSGARRSLAAPAPRLEPKAGPSARPDDGVTVVTRGSKSSRYVRDQRNRNAHIILLFKGGKKMADKRPLPLDRAERSFKTRKALKPAPITRTSRIFVRGGREPPRVQTRVVPIRQAEQGTDYEIVLEVAGVDAGARALPQCVKGTAVKPGELKMSRDEAERLLTGFVPDHLGLSVRPQQLLKPFITIPRDPPRDRKVPTTLFGNDDRRTFQDTNYPWSTVGLVETNRGSGSGVMIGPRHLLTVSHVIDWSAPAGFAADWVRFTPSYFDGGTPFGVSHGIHIYWYVQEDGDNSITDEEGRHDYVVVVLDQRMGDATGWMGARGYDDDWDSLNVWSHMGYPGDLNSGQRPIFISPFLLDGNDAAAQEILHQADVFVGQSGGPMFAWWDGEVGPRAVAVQSWQTASNNGASGGRDLFDLVVRARNEFA
jgi:V8-like Glu-specific endopeptidase